MDAKKPGHCSPTAFFFVYENGSNSVSRYSSTHSALFRPLKPGQRSCVTVYMFSRFVPNQSADCASLNPAFRFAHVCRVRAFASEHICTSSNTAASNGFLRHQMSTRDMDALPFDVRTGLPPDVRCFQFCRLKSSRETKYQPSSPAWTAARLRCSSATVRPAVLLFAHSKSSCPLTVFRVDSQFSNVEGGATMRARFALRLTRVCTAMIVLPTPGSDPFRPAPLVVLVNRSITFCCSGSSSKTLVTVQLDRSPQMRRAWRACVRQKSPRSGLRPFQFPAVGTSVPGYRQTPPAATRSSSTTGR